MTEVHITLYIGNDFQYKLYAKDADDAVYPLTGGWTAAAQVRLYNALGSTLVNLNPTITNGSTGEVTLTVTDTTTAALSPAEGGWDMVLISPAGLRLGPFVGGGASVLLPVTQ